MHRLVSQSPGQNEILSTRNPQSSSLPRAIESEAKNKQKLSRPAKSSPLLVTRALIFPPFDTSLGKPWTLVAGFIAKVELGSTSAMSLLRRQRPTCDGRSGNFPVLRPSHRASHRRNDIVNQPLLSYFASNFVGDCTTGKPRSFSCISSHQSLKSNHLWPCGAHLRSSTDSRRFLCVRTRKG